MWWYDGDGDGSEGDMRMEHTSVIVWNSEDAILSNSAASTFCSIAFSVVSVCRTNFPHRSEIFTVLW